jgi:uncharacterized protein YacL (UPF0231 family)
MSTVGSSLLDEIERVSALLEKQRQRHDEMRGWQRILIVTGMEPMLFMMKREIDLAKASVASDDAIACIRSLKALQGYADD